MENMKQWIRNHNLWNETGTIYGIAQDNAAVTSPEKCRYDVCLLRLQSDSLENKEFNEILDMIVTRMTEYSIHEQRKHTPEIDALIENNVSLSVQVKNILRKLDEDPREVLERYYEQSEKIADVQIKYLYIQGAKDCVQLLKKLGAFD